MNRYAPTGELDTVVTLPVPPIMSCAFFDNTLLVTTGRATRPDGMAIAPRMSADTTRTG